MSISLICIGKDQKMQLRKQHLSVYSTIYPYHPQIEVTNDGSYLISQDWTTLTAKNAREVIMDTLDVEIRL